MVFIVEAGELIKIRYDFITHFVFGSFGSKPFIVEAGELIKIRYIIKVHFGSSRSKP